MYFSVRFDFASSTAWLSRLGYNAQTGQCPPVLLVSVAGATTCPRQAAWIGKLEVCRHDCQRHHRVELRHVPAALTRAQHQCVSRGAAMGDVLLMLLEPERP